jgi:hypothetical protein
LDEKPIHLGFFDSVQDLFPYLNVFQTYPRTYLQIGDRLYSQKYTLIVVTATHIQKEIQMKKIWLVTAAIILLAILSACGTVEATNDSQHVTELASKIADFDLPEGYTSEFSAELAGYTLTAYKGTSGPSHLFLIQSEKEADGQELERMLTQLAPGSSDPNTRLTVIENRPVTIRGQEVTLVISDGVNHDGDSYRQATVAFQGKGGPALLVLSEPTDHWNDEIVNALIASIQ